MAQEAGFADADAADEVVKAELEKERASQISEKRGGGKSAVVTRISTGQANAEAEERETRGGPQKLYGASHPLPELSSEFFRQQESSVHISEMSQKCCLYAHFEWLTGPALRNVISDEVSGDKVSMHYLVLLNENILFIAMISCRLWLYTGPVAANFFSSFFLATDRQ